MAIVKWSETVEERLSYIADQHELVHILPFDLICETAKEALEVIERLRDQGDPSEVCDDPWTCCLGSHREYARELEQKDATDG